jgi:3-oxoacyl-[acyl-carrier-protein] synthase III
MPAMTQTTTDIAYAAAVQALEGIDRESLDYVIVAQNFGDVQAGNLRTDMVPTIASRVKHRLRIKNPYTVAYDIPFGCPGWIQGMIMADYYIRSGDARRVLVIGAEILSRVSDPHDVDSMIFADGAGATLVEASENPGGILTHITRTDTIDNAWMLRVGNSYNPDWPGDEIFIKMDGHDIYRYALKTVPLVVKQALDKAGLNLGDVKRILMHQANAKMDEAILKRLFQAMQRRHHSRRCHAHDYRLVRQQLRGHYSHPAGPAAERATGRPSIEIRGCRRVRLRRCRHEHQRHGLSHALILYDTSPETVTYFPHPVPLPKGARGRRLRPWFTNEMDPPVTPPSPIEGRGPG